MCYYTCLENIIYVNRHCLPMIGASKDHYIENIIYVNRHCLPMISDYKYYYIENIGSLSMYTYSVFGKLERGIHGEALTSSGAFELNTSAQRRKSRDRFRI